MGNREKNRTTSMLDQSRRGSQAAYQPAINMARQDLADARDYAPGLRDQIRGLYGNMSQGGRWANNWDSSSDSFRLPGSGSWQTNSEGAKVWVPNQNSDFNVARRGFTELGKTGGINRGDWTESQGGFRNLMNTGGIDVGAIRSAATVPVTAAFRSMADDMARRRSLQGGYSPGYDDQTAALNRDAAFQASDAARMAEGQAQGMLQQGKLAGASGLADIANRIAGMEQQGRLAGFQGLSNLGQTELGAQLQMANQYDQNVNAGAGGLMNLYGSSPGMVDSAYRNLYAGLGGSDQSNLSYLGHRAQLNPGRDWLGTGMGLLGGVGGMMMGLGPMGLGMIGNKNNYQMPGAVNPSLWDRW